LSVYSLNMEEAAMVLASQREFSVTKQHQPSDLYGGTSNFAPARHGHEMILGTSLSDVNLN
jgi:hypothetical protein